MSSLFATTNNLSQLKPSSSTTTSLFNTNPTQTQPQTQTQTQPTQPTQPNSLFSNPNLSLQTSTHQISSPLPNHSLFGSRPSPLTTSTANLNNSTTHSSILGTTQNRFIRSTTTNGKIEPSIEDKIMRIYSAWNVQDPNCEFQAFFYNLVEPEQVNFYQRPALAQNEARWQLAKRSNPDPSRMVPTLAIGFEDLSKRIHVQRHQAQLHLEKLQEISTRLETLTRQLNLRTTTRLHKLRTQQTQLTTQLIHLISTRLNPLSSTMISEEDEVRIEALDQSIRTIKDRLMVSGGRSKLGELWAYLVGIKNQVEGLEGGGTGGKWTITDEREIKKVLEVLMNQQKGIDHLTNVLTRSEAEVRLMAHSFQIG